MALLKITAIKNVKRDMNVKPDLKIGGSTDQLDIFMINFIRFFLIIALISYVIGLLCGYCGAEEIGTCSWYGGNKNAYNRYTASGEEFDDTLLAAASWSYPFGTLLIVTNVRSSASVVVRVNDRGPNKRLGRVIDLTRRAFSEIADLKEGLIKVRIERETCQK